MFVVTVEFVAVPEKRVDFRAALIDNARASRETEPGCRQFDVTVSSDDDSLLFLYEVYDDRAAFDAHVASPHFRSFDAAIRGWVARKRVRTFERIDPPPGTMR
jgi:autoinducer 2-degrading protein